MSELSWSISRGSQKHCDCPRLHLTTTIINLTHPHHHSWCPPHASWTRQLLALQPSTHSWNGYPIIIDSCHELNVIHCARALFHICSSLDLLCHYHYDFVLLFTRMYSSLTSLGSLPTCYTSILAIRAGELKVLPKRTVGSESSCLMYMS